MRSNSSFLRSFLIPVTCLLISCNFLSKDSSSSFCLSESPSFISFNFLISSIKSLMQLRISRLSGCFGGARLNQKNSKILPSTSFRCKAGVGGSESSASLLIPEIFRSLDPDLLESVISFFPSEGVPVDDPPSDLSRKFTEISMKTHLYYP